MYTHPDYQQFQKFDLHCHTLHSDGTLSVPDLLSRANEQAIDCLSITDHDTIDAYHELSNNPDTGSLHLLPGVEISAESEHHSVHIVGLGIDIHHESLTSLLSDNQARRVERARKIYKKLSNRHAEIGSEDYQELGGGKVICRTHIARHLVDKALVKDFNAAFKSYLNRNGGAWVRVDWPSMQEVIDSIHAAGGKAVLAHPTKYKVKGNRLKSLMTEFVESGGDAIELAYPGLNPNQRADLVRYCRSRELAVSQGSDFHHPGTSWTELGAFGTARLDLPKVWELF